MSTPETTYLQDGDVTITSARAVIAGKTYAMSNVTSVSMGQKGANWAPGVIAILSGVFCSGIGLLGSEGINMGLLIVGILVGLGGIYLVFRARPRYIVRIGSASGEADGLISGNQARIHKIVNAMNEAIVKRG